MCVVKEGVECAEVGRWHRPERGRSTIQGFNIRGWAVPVGSGRRTLELDGVEGLPGRVRKPCTATCLPLSRGSGGHHVRMPEDSLN